MLARLLLAASWLLLVVAVPEASEHSVCKMSDAEQCCEFVRNSIAVQRTLAEKIKQLNGRKVYLFDATGFASAFVDDVTVDSVRYKTGALDGVLVDAVLSQSAQRTLSGRPGSETFHRWLGNGTLDAYGVYI